LVGGTPSARNLQAAGQAGEEPEESAPEGLGTRAVRLGMAFHEAMERVDLWRPECVARCARELDIRYKLDREAAEKLEEMMRLSLSSELLERARAAASSGGRILRELPFVRPLGPAAIEEGKIDLLFEEPGGWVLVDYKTDWVSNCKEEAEEFFHNRYAGQIREYAEALRTLSLEVVSAYLLLARTGNAVKMI